MPNDLIIDSLRGGMVEDDMPAALDPTEAELMMNVEFFYSTLGERRLGMEPFPLTGSGLDTQEAIVHLTERFPDNNILEPEYWAIAVTGGTGTSVWARYTAGTWIPVTPIDPLLVIAPDAFNIQSVELNNKLFFAYNSGVDRLHVWDGTSLRPTGLSQPPAPPTAVDEGADTFLLTRYYRFRYITKDGDTILRRSEPSDAVTFVPSGVGAGAAVTRSGLVGEGETHWELEASDDGSEFFRIATEPIATLTINDEVDLDTDSYNNHGPVSEPIGNYLLLPSARFIAADADRLLLGGHWNDDTRKSRVAWTPVFNDPGAGNDERLPLSTGGDNFVDLNNYEGGGLTGITQVENGEWFAFKYNHIYKLTRTGDLTHAYEPICLSKVRGALTGSITSGIDEAGQACAYFLDPVIGPCMVGRDGLREILGMRDTWKRVSFVQEIGIIARACYYPDKKQVHWWITTEDELSPNLKIILQVNYMRSRDGDTIKGAWVQANGAITAMLTVGMWHELFTDGVRQRLVARPFIGGFMTTGIQRTDVNDTDAGVPYYAKIRTKPYIQNGLLNNWGSMTTAILAGANDVANIVVSTYRDFGLEQNDRLTDLAPVATEPYVIKRLDDLAMSESASIQFQFADPVP